MDREQLHEEWQQNKHRPAYVRNRRDEIQEHTSIEEPIPQGSLYEVRGWLDSYMGVVTKQLGDKSNTEGDE